MDLFFGHILKFYSTWYYRFNRDMFVLVGYCMPLDIFRFVGLTAY